MPAYFFIIIFGQMLCLGTNLRGMDMYGSLTDSIGTFPMQLKVHANWAFLSHNLNPKHVFL